MLKEENKSKKIFVLDTSVILYDHNAIQQFAEHDVAIPITVLEELDNFKKGNDIKNFSAREFIRMVDGLSKHHTLQDWVNLNGSDKKGKFKVVMHSKGEIDADKVFGEKKNDHKILNAALSLKHEYPDRQIILVSKDINLRLKARALTVTAEDFETGKVKHVDELYRGITITEKVSSDALNALYQHGSCKADDAGITDPEKNHFYILKGHKQSAVTWFDYTTGMLERIEKRSASGIIPLNAEQIFALHAVMNPRVRLVTIQGVAGTGKTLLALAGAIQQRENFKQIYITRPIVPLGNKDIGYLPGDIKSKINPYMEPLWDNLGFIQSQFSETSKEGKKLQKMKDDEKLIITPLAYIRGRSISNTFFIVDEAQNLTPHEVKTIITRAGENTKIVFTGDIFQIDTPYLDAQSNGLSYLIDKIRNHELCAHVRLEKGERSELANLANELL